MKLAWRVETPSEEWAGKLLRDIVFLHGTGSNSHMWQRQSEFVAKKGHRAFLLDLPGHGQSASRASTISLAQYEEDVLETMTAAAVNFPAYFVGHSLGAIISVSLASKRPELFAGIFAASLPGKVLSPLPLALKGFVRGPMQTLRSLGFHKLLGWRERTLFEMDAAVLDDIAVQFADLSLVKEPLHIKCPVHFANGLFDPVAPYWHVVSMHRMLPGSTLKTFRLGGHNFMDAEEDAVNKWLAQYLEPCEKKSVPHR